MVYKRYKQFQLILITKGGVNAIEHHCLHFLEYVLTAGNCCFGPIINKHIDNEIKNIWNRRTEHKLGPLAMIRKRNCRNTRRNQVNTLHHCNCDL